MQPVIVLFPNEGEKWMDFSVRVHEEHKGQLYLILSGPDETLSEQPEDLRQFLGSLHDIASRIRIVTRKRVIVEAAQAHKISVVSRASDVKRQLADHPKVGDVLLRFAPHLWRQQLRSKLQSMGLLALPTIRIWVLIGLSIGLFGFVLLRLLPSAEVRIWPQQETVSQAANVLLAQSGAYAPDQSRVRTIPLIPFTVTVSHQFTFDGISKEFIGTSAQTRMTVINKAQESYSLRKGTRLVNQAGMVFRLEESVQVAAGKTVTAKAKADPIDIYEKTIGERGNVPAGVRWEFVGLSPEERKLVYAENRVPATGGVTRERTVLKQQDLENARVELEKALLKKAQSLTLEKQVLYNAEHANEQVVFLTSKRPGELDRRNFHSIVLPTQFLGQPVGSIPVEGSLTYSVYGYDARAVLTMLKEELSNHVTEGKRLLTQTIRLDRLSVIVIAYADDLSWMKITAELTGTEQFILDPVSPTGALFGKRVREKVAGIPKKEAVSIIRNLPEVDNVEISFWPPWNQTLPTIPSHITIIPVIEDTDEVDESLPADDS